MEIEIPKFKFSFCKEEWYGLPAYEGKLIIGYMLCNGQFTRLVIYYYSNRTLTSFSGYAPSKSSVNCLYLCLGLNSKA